MPNQDGFEPGQVVSFADAMRANRQRGARKPALPSAPEDVDVLGKAEVRNLLDLHGVDVPPGAKVADMRAMLKRVIFVAM